MLFAQFSLLSLNFIITILSSDLTRSCATSGFSTTMVKVLKPTVRHSNGTTEIFALTQRYP